MSTFNLPANTVRFYNDGPDFPATPLLLEAEQAYRQAFGQAASEVARWTKPNTVALKLAWERRRQARAEAEVFVPSAELFGIPGLDSEQVVYRAGHEVAASRTRGRVQAFELAMQSWESLRRHGKLDEWIRRQVIQPWTEKISEWSRQAIHPETYTGPPAPWDLNATA